MNESNAPIFVVDRDNAHRDHLHAHLRSLKPHFEGLPDYGLMLPPEDEAELRAYAQANDIDFDEMKRQFEMSHQVIPARNRGYIYRNHMDKRIIPVNGLRDYFHGQMSGEVYCRKCEAEIAAERKEILL